MSGPAMETPESEEQERVAQIVTLVRQALERGCTGRAMQTAEDAQLTHLVGWLLYDVWQSGQVGGLLADAVTRAWTLAEGPGSGLPEEGWLSLFRAAGVIVRTSPEPRFTPLLKRPAEPLEIWRGGVVAERMAWSAYRECAREFAVREAGFFRAMLFRASIEPDDILALFNGDLEQEVVVDPAGLKDVEREETIEPSLFDAEGDVATRGDA